MACITSYSFLCVTPTNTRLTHLDQSTTGRGAGVKGLVIRAWLLLIRRLIERTTLGMGHVKYFSWQDITSHEKGSTSSSLRRNPAQACPYGPNDKKITRMEKNTV
jgi:hypothetical protein